MNFYEYVEQKKRDQRTVNLNLVRQEINKSWVKTKINNFLNRFLGFTYEEVRQKILTDDVVAALFAKDPGRQNISEIAAADFLKLVGWKQLPNGGPNSFSFSETGELIQGTSSGGTKTVDFIRGDVYASQKYTMGNGGAQDNQYRDVINFLTLGSKQHKVCAIVDGDFYLKKRDELIKMFANNSNVAIYSVEDFIE